MASDKLAETLTIQKRGVQNARALLEQASETLEQVEPAEQLADTARRVKSAAVLASTAVNELFVSVGFFELGHEIELALPDYVES